MARTGRGMPHRAPSYPTYSPAAPVVQDTYDAYNAEKKAKYVMPRPHYRSLHATGISLPDRGRACSLGRSRRRLTHLKKIKDELGPETEITSPIVPQPAQASVSTAAAPASHSDREAVHVIIEEFISAKVSRDGSLESFDIKGALSCASRTQRLPRSN